MRVETLIDRGAVHAGSVSALARLLQTTPSRVFEWRAGSRPCPAEIQDRVMAIACLSDAEVAAHVFARAGVSRPRWTTAASVAAFAGSLGIGVAAFVARFGDATMYRPNLRQGDRRREQSSECQLALS